MISEQTNTGLLENTFMDTFDISVKKFDAIMCAFCLPFLSGNDASKLIADCAEQLNENGVIYISTMEGDESKAGFETTSFTGDSTVFFNYHELHILEKALVENGFLINNIKRQDYIEPNGTNLIDLILIGIKTSGHISAS